MRQILAILRDSYHEAIARRSLVVMIVLSTLPILFFASLRFEEATVQEAVEVQAGIIAQRIGASRSHDPEPTGTDERPRVSSVTAVTSAPGPEGAWSPAVAEGWMFEITGDLETSAAVRRTWMRSWGRRSGETVPDEIDWPLFATTYFESKGFTAVEVQQRVSDAGRGTVAIALVAPDTVSVAGGHRLRLLWGAFDIALERSSAGELLVIMQSQMALGLVGFVGILLAIVLTAALIPNMLEKGTLDLMLARPIGRTKLLLTKYVGGCWFVAILATYALVGSWLALRLATGYGSAWVLVAIPSMIAAFALLYSVSALVGVLTRSTLIAILAPCGVWFVSSVIESGRELAASFGSDLSPWVPPALDSAYWVFPKLGIFDALVVKTLTDAELPAGTGRIFGRAPSVEDLEWALATNGIFAAVMLAWAVWAFRRRDY